MKTILVVIFSIISFFILLLLGIGAHIATVPIYGEPAVKEVAFYKILTWIFIIFAFLSPYLWFKLFFRKK